MNIWTILGLIILSYMAFNVVLSFRLRNKNLAIIAEKKVFYKDIDNEKFDNIPNEQLIKAIYYQVWNIEDEDFEHVMENLTVGQRNIFTIYQVESVANDRRLGFEYIYQTNYTNYIKEAFKAIEANAIVELFEKIDQIQIELSKQRFDDEEEIEIPTYYELKEKYKEIAFEIKLNELCIKYIRDNKKDFINA